jgi:general secretion pathway protein D
MTLRSAAHLALAGLLAASPLPIFAAQQSAPPAAGSPNSEAQARPEPDPSKHITEHDRRRAASLYLRASKLFEQSKFDQSRQLYEQAAALVPTNPDYALATKIARSHQVAALLQSATQDRIRDHSAAASTALDRALVLDPASAQVAEHFSNTPLPPTASLYDSGQDSFAAAPELAPTSGTHSFHLRAPRIALIQQVFSAYGIQATVAPDVSAASVLFNMDDATFAQVLRALNLATNTFWVPIDAHRVLVALDTPLNRERYERQELETVYLPAMSNDERTQIGNMARNLFGVPRVTVQQTGGTLTLRAPTRTLDDFNATLRSLLGGRSQVLLDVRLIQIAHTRERNTGILPPQQITAFNVYAEEQAILNANQALVQQIISSGLAAPGDTLAILGILLASGQVSSSLFSSGIALFGGGLTLSGLSPGPVTGNLSLNSSSSRELDEVQLRVADDQAGTFVSGLRYPITSSSYSSLGASNINIPGLTTAGTSSSLSSILSSLEGASQTIPQVEYQDLGLTVKATPDVMRNGDVALTLDVKISALAGTALNGVPVLSNRSYSGVVTLKEGSGVVIMSELDRQESNALSGAPGLSEIPGLDNITGKDNQQNYSTLLLIISPHVVRDPHPAGRTPMLRIDRSISRD